MNARVRPYRPEGAGDIVGFLSVEDDGHLDLAFVRPDRMGRGVAKALLHRCVEWARARGLPGLRTEASHLARRFFTRAGWHVKRPETILRNGVALDRFHMTVALGDSDDRSP